MSTVVDDWPERTRPDVREETRRFARLFVVGLAWGVPFLPTLFINTAPGVPARPRLAHLLAPHGWQLFALMLLSSCVGIALVAVLGREPLRIGAKWLALAALPLVLVGGMAFLATGLDRSGVWYVALTVSMFAALAVLPLVGVVVTYLALWRRWRWPALLWPMCWVGVALLGWAASSETAGSGKDLGVGLAEFASLCSLLIVVCIASVLACALTGAFNLSKRPAHRTSTSSRPARGL